MAEIKFKGKTVHTSGVLPALHTKAPDFLLTDKNLSDHSLKEYQGKRKIIATVPSLDTGVCSIMTKHFNEFGKKNPHFISADLPFAQNRFCESEGVHHVTTLSMLRNKDFGKSYGILISDGPLAGLLARSVWVLDEKDHILYVELVPEITQEPNYHKALQVLQGH